ncbi:MAG: hypothetical protein ACI4ST_03805 [Candidatus Gallimonas sp.]
MNYYIMIEVGIVGMGGGQMYIRNKAKYMNSKGWNTLVFSGLNGKIEIPDLFQFRKYIIPELVSSPYVYSKQTVLKTINNIIAFLDKSDKIIVESGAPHCAYWGELVAEKLHAKHIPFILDESPDKEIPKQYLPFYKFKADRRELAGIADNTFKLIFHDNNFVANYDARLPAVCQNVVVDYDSNVLAKIPRKGINIGIMGRLDKPYISIATDAVLKLADKHQNELFNVIYIGDTDLGNKEKRFRKAFHNYDNVSLVFLGYLYPLPRKLFDQIDYFIASSGSANVSYGENKPTISIDGIDGKAIGVLGFTTQNTVYREHEPKQEVADLMEKIIFDNFLKDKEYIPRGIKPDISTFSVHLDFINNSARAVDYFPVFSLRAAGKDRKKRFFRKLLGLKLYMKIRPLYSKILKNSIGKC